MNLQWLCGIDGGLLVREKQEETVTNFGTDELLKGLQTQQLSYPQTAHLRLVSAQPTRHAPMAVLIVEKDCEVERIRGGCFPCQVSLLHIRPD